MARDASSIPTVRLEARVDDLRQGVPNKQLQK
jgi:hypothetical protein